MVSGSGSPSATCSRLLCPSAAEKDSRSSSTCWSGMRGSINPSKYYVWSTAASPRDILLGVVEEAIFSFSWGDLYQCMRAKEREITRLWRNLSLENKTHWYMIQLVSLVPQISTKTTMHQKIRGQTQNAMLCMHQYSLCQSVVSKRHVTL